MVIFYSKLLVYQRVVYHMYIYRYLILERNYTLWLFHIAMENHHF